MNEFIERVGKYINSPVLTREMALELIEFITIDKIYQGGVKNHVKFIFTINS